MEYRYETKVHKDSWFIRLYLWAWQADVESVDFCRLFWGYIFMPLNLLIRGICAPFYYGFKGLKWGARKIGATLGPVIEKVLPERQPLPRESFRVPPSRPKRRKSPNLTGLLSKISWLADRCVGFMQVTWRIIRWPVKILGFACAAAVAAAIVGVVVFGLIKLAGLLSWLLPEVGAWLGDNIGTGLLIAAIALVGIAVLIGVVEGGRHLATRTPVGPAVMNGTVGFFGAMKTGALGVKSRTCPKIVVIDREGKPAS